MSVLSTHQSAPIYVYDITYQSAPNYVYDVYPLDYSCDERVGRNALSLRIHNPHVLYVNMYVYYKHVYIIYIYL